MSNAVENVLPPSRFHSGSEIISVLKIDEAIKEDEKDEELELVISGQGANNNYVKRIRPCLYNNKNLPLSLDEPKTSNLTIIPGPFPCFPWPPIRPWPPLPPIKPVSKSSNFIERLWVHLTIEKLLDDKANNGNLTKEERRE